MHNNILLQVFTLDQLEQISKIFSLDVTNGLDAYWFRVEDIVGVRTLFNNLIVIDMTNERSCEMSITRFNWIKEQLQETPVRRTVELPNIPQKAV